jgi:hypothetical protein
MRRSFALSIATLTLLAGLALADPGVTVRYAESGVAIVQLEGSYAGSRYTVYRAGAMDQAFDPVTDGEVVCTGDCFAVDAGAQPGRTYWYRFDLSLAGGGFASFGPYPVTMPGNSARSFGVRVSPNPGRGPTRVELSLAGAPGDPALEAEATLHDVQGRRLATLHRGALARGLTMLDWDGRAGDGRELAPGIYYLRLRSGASAAIARVVRIR